MPVVNRQQDKPPLLPVGAGGDPAEGGADPTGPTTGEPYKCKSFNYNAEKHIPFPAPRSPFLAYFLIFVNGIDMVNGINSDRPQYVTYFDFELVGEGYTECNFRVFDPMWDVVEGQVLGDNKLLEAYRRNKESQFKIGAPCEVQFGYARGVEPNVNPEKNQNPLVDLWSPRYPMYLYDYQPKFMGYGVEIDIKLMCYFGTAASATPELQSWTATQIATQNMADGQRGIFEDKCNEYGFSPCSPKSAPLMEIGTDFETPNPNYPPFVQPGVDTATFLRHILAPSMMDAASVNGNNIPQFGGSMVTFTPDDNYLHMHNGLPGTNHVREYFYARQQFGTVLSFRPQVTGAALANFAGSSIFMQTLDHTTGDVISADIDPKEFLNQTFVTNGGNLEDLIKIYDKKKTTVLGTFLPTSQANLGNMIVEGVNMLARSKYFANEAELVVLGDPLIKPMRNVLVIVMTYRKKEDGRIVPRIHYTSGIWGVKTVRHIIQNGEFITNLHLFRNDRISPEGLRAASEILKSADVDGIQNPPPEDGGGTESQQSQAGLQNNFPTNDVLR